MLGCFPIVGSLKAIIGVKRKQDMIKERKNKQKLKGRNKEENKTFKNKAE